ncbi:YqgE/AlgH family protein [Alienimonas sp. DA493]|uniref:YqgE/AlgH family protein n=1 Tax=Alienimonas sp. DA493 TaxID=3373605 RepID=UPI0037549768
MASPPSDPSEPAGSPGEPDRPRSESSERDRSKTSRPSRGRADRDAPRREERDERDVPGDDEPGGGSLRGRILVAGRHLRDPNFYRTLVLLVEHGEDGAFGLVVNRPTDTTVRRALSGHLEVEEGADSVFSGGPVEPAALFVLHNSVEFAEGELPVCSGLFVGNSREAFEGLVNAVDAGDEETRYRVFSGCSGWGPGQLEQELARADWRVVDADAVLDGPADPIFGPDPYGAWEEVDRLSARPPLDGLDGSNFRMN